MLLVSILTACNFPSYDAKHLEQVLLQADSIFHGHEEDFFYEPDELPADLELAADYFIKKKDHAKVARALRYLGVRSIAIGDVEPTMQYLKDAEYHAKLAADTNSIIITKYAMAFWCLQYDQTLGENDSAYEGIAMIDEALALCHEDEYYMRSRLLNLKAMYHVRLGEPNAAEMFGLQGLANAEKAHSTTARNEALHNLSLIYRHQKRLEESINCARQCLSPDDSIGYPNQVYQLASAFYCHDDMDSATYYSGLLDSLLIHMEGSEKAGPFRMKCYNLLSHVAQNYGNDTLAVYYVRKHESLYYDMVEKYAEKNISRIQRQYDYQLLQDAMDRKNARNQRIIALMALVAALLLTAFSVSQLRLEKKKKTEAEAQAKLFHYILNNKDLKQKYEGVEEAARDYAKMLTEAWTKEEMIMLKLSIFLKGKSDKASMEELKRTVFGKEAPWEAMMNVVDKIYPSLRETIRQKHPDLNDDEQKDFLLSYFNVSRQDEAALLDVSVSVVDKLRNKTRKKIANSSDFSEKSSD